MIGGYTFALPLNAALAGGRMDGFRSRRLPAKKKSYVFSCLNRRHMLWAWYELTYVMFSDVYVAFARWASGPTGGSSDAPIPGTHPCMMCCVIGAGGAGLRAAIEASSWGLCRCI